MLAFHLPSDAAREVRPQVKQTLVEIENYLTRQLAQLEAHNNGLSLEAKRAIQQQRALVLAQSARADALGIQV